MSNARILAMDDEESIRENISSLLKHGGYDVVTVADGSEAIKLYRLSKGLGHPYDVVILDLTVPGGIGGMETIRRLQEIDPEVKAIATSHYFNSNIMPKPENYGFKAAIQKPFNAVELSKVLQEVLAGGQ